MGVKCGRLQGWEAPFEAGTGGNGSSKESRTKSQQHPAHAVRHWPACLLALLPSLPFRRPPHCPSTARCLLCLAPLGNIATCLLPADGVLNYSQDGHRQRTVDWCDATGGTAAAFDFTLKVGAGRADRGGCTHYWGLVALLVVGCTAWWLGWTGQADALVELS